MVIIEEYAKASFSSTAILDFVSGVGPVTTRMRASWILNVGGCIAVCLIDMLMSCGVFSDSEVQDFMDFGCLNGLFVLGRSLFGTAASEATSPEAPAG